MPCGPTVPALAQDKRVWLFLIFTTKRADTNILKTIPPISKAWKGTEPSHPLSPLTSSNQFFKIKINWNPIFFKAYSQRALLLVRTTGKAVLWFCFLGISSLLLNCKPDETEVAVLALKFSHLLLRNPYEPLISLSLHQKV